MWNQIGREEKLSGLDLCPWEGTQRKKEITQVETLHGELAIQATYSVSQTWDLTKGSQPHSAHWRASETERRAVGSLGPTQEECPNACWLLKQGRESRLKLCGWLTHFP